jgi:predicted phosphodiesterase
MRIGILADIHNAVSPLRRALSHFDRCGVDLVVTLGDAFESYEPGSSSVQIASLLTQVGAKGVWGNHDAGLSIQVSNKIRREADPELLEFTASLEPHLVVDQCRFSHNEPWLDARKMEELWYFERIPVTRKQAYQSFDSVPEKYLFMGHHHVWIAIGSSGRIQWDAKSHLLLASEDRCLVLVAAVYDGWCSIFDTESRVLMPFRCAA